MPAAKAVGERNWHALPGGMVKLIGRVCALAHELNLINAGVSSDTPLHFAPKSLAMFFASSDGDVGGAEFVPDT